MEVDESGVVVCWVVIVVMQARCLWVSFVVVENSVLQLLYRNLCEDFNVLYAIMGSFCVGGRCFGARFFFISVSFHMKFVINRTAGALKH